MHGYCRDHAARNQRLEMAPVGLGLHDLTWLHRSTAGQPADLSMDESTQQILALTIVAAAVAVELIRRYRKKKAGKPGCEDCPSDTGERANEKGEAPVKFYKKN